jgi:hypothetical protein
MRSSTVLRLAWGRFAQSQRGYELMVEDADPHPYPVERAQHWVAGFDLLFRKGPLTSLRVESYRRPLGNPRPRYESLYKPFDAFPEGEVDRVRIEPERSLARGIELLARGRSMRRVDWWLDYAWASTHDRLDGRDVPRRIDQTHTLNVDVNYRLAPQWNLNAAWLSHTGWPTTPVSIETDEAGRIVPILGALNSERLPAYRRLDVRLSRQWQTGRGPLSVFFDAHNLLLRKNVSGLDLIIDDETGELLIDREYWPRFFASAGIVWEMR